uniref:Uncharacterized protein n=1 Tax=Ananas comosus var. bracteatus TaxID=296719 RepID=A0A6V7PGS5_ANACO|nr:unnamed protein product [Ananas comosus var. bracteatus]
MFLHTVGHHTKNRIVKIEFIRSGETISRYFSTVLRAICAIKNQFVQQAGPEIHPEIASSPLYFPYFKDCIGLLDGTHIEAKVPVRIATRFRGRKGLTQNVMAAVKPDCRFTYVSTGWEGSANDFTVLKHALSLPPPSGLWVIEGKYYLVDTGYTTMHGFLAPYRSVRYHLKEHEGRTPQNKEELFNLRHASLRSKVERSFGILKNRFKILTSKPFFPFRTQVEIVLSCCVLHNYILTVDPHDPFLNDESNVCEDDVNYYSQTRSQREHREESRQWVELRDNIAEDMW